MEPEREKEGTFMPCESAGTTYPASEMLCAEKTLQAENAHLQTCSEPHAPCDKRESCHQQVFCEQGMSIISNGDKSKNDISPFALRDVDSIPDKQDRVCTVLSSANLCDEPGEGQQRYSFDSGDCNGTDALCRLSCDGSPFEANPKSVLESGEPGCKGGADISAVHDKLWKLLNEDDSDCQIPYQNRGITSLEIRPSDLKVTEPNFVPETCSTRPLPINGTEEQEAIAQPASRHRAEQEGCDVSKIPLQTDEACNSASIGHICLAQEGEADGVRLDSSAGNEVETPSIHVSTSSIILNRGKCLEQKPNRRLTGGEGSTRTAVPWEGKCAINNASQTCDADSPQRLKDAQSGNSACATENPPYMSGGAVGQSLHTEHSVSLINGCVTGEGGHFRDCHPAPTELASFPEETDVFSSGNTHQLRHDRHSSVNTRHQSDEKNLQEKGNHSDLNAQKDTNSDSYHLSENDDCQHFQTVSRAQKYSYVMQLPNLIKAPETRTCKNLHQNIEQLTEIEKPEVAFAPFSEDPFLRDFCVEASGYKPCKPGEEQRETCLGDERRAETSSDSGVSHVSERQTAVSPRGTSEQHVCFVGSTFPSAEELNPDSSQTHTFVSVSTPLPREAPRECHSLADEGYSGSGTQQLTVRGTSPCFPPVRRAEDLPTGVSAVGCPGTGSQVKPESTQTAVKADENVGVRGTFCRALQGQFRGVPKQDEEEAVLCENTREGQRAVERNPAEAEMRSPAHAVITSKAQRPFMNISTKQSCPGLISSSKLTAPIKLNEPDKEVTTSESVVSGSVNLLPVDSGNKQCFQQQPPCSRTQLTAYEPFPVRAERLRNQEGSKARQASPTAAEPEPLRCKLDTAKGGHLAGGAKKKSPPDTLSKKPRLEERGSVSKDPSCAKKPVKSEAGVIPTEDRKEQRKPSLKKESKGKRRLVFIPVLSHRSGYSRKLNLIKHPTSLL